MSKLRALLFGASAGAGATYYLDRGLGKRRRALLIDKLDHASHVMDDAAVATYRDCIHRGRGFAAELLGLFSEDSASDDVIGARVRSKLGHVCSHPGAIGIQVQDGNVWLSGNVLRPEIEQTLAGVRRVKGVRGVKHDFVPHDDGSHVSDLQGGVVRTGERFEFFQERWAPSARLLAGGAGLTCINAARRLPMPLGILLGGAGGLLTARAASNLSLKRMFGVGAEQRAIDIKKSLHIKAPIDQCYYLLRNPENFPRLFEHILDVVKLDDGLYQWKVTGPLGLPVSWNAMITKLEENALVAWQTVADSVVQSRGIVRFESVTDGTTRVHIEMSYNPPLGAVGHGIAKLFAIDPKRQLDDDLIRLKSLLEQGRATAHHHQLSRDEVLPHPQLDNPHSSGRWD